MKIPLTVVLAILATACSSVKPIAIHSGDACFRCRRPIVDTKLGVEIVDMAGRAFKFRTPGCLAQYLAEHPAEHPEDLRAVFATDHATGKLIDANGASFVNVEIDRQTGERDYLAFALAADAARAADAHRTSSISWQQVLGRARQVDE